MGIAICDIQTNEVCFSINFWHWRAIVEEVRRLNLLPEKTVDGLHEPWCGNGLSKEQCHQVAMILKEKTIPTLEDAQRILIDGQRTTQPDDGKLYKDEIGKNYSTNKEVLLEFADAIEACNGFVVIQ